MHREKKVVVVSVADFFSARQPDGSPLSPAGGLGLPHLAPARAPEPKAELEGDTEFEGPEFEGDTEFEDGTGSEGSDEFEDQASAEFRDQATAEAYVAPPVEQVPVPAAPAVKISPAYALRPLSDALCPECGEPRHSAGPHQHGPVSSRDD